MLAAFLKINGDLRKINADQIAALAAKTSPTRLWDGPFVQLGNSQVEASFADHRTYIYNGKEVDQQTHLGFDLAVTAARAGRRGQRRHRRQRQLARHLRQLRHHRPRAGRAVALRPPDVVRRQGGRHGDARPADRAKRFDRARRRRPPAFHACWSAAGWSTRWNGGTRTGLRTGSSASSAKPASTAPATRAVSADKADMVDCCSVIFCSGEVNASTKRLGRSARNRARERRSACGGGSSETQPAAAAAAPRPARRRARRSIRRRLAT